MNQLSLAVREAARFTPMILSELEQGRFQTEFTGGTSQEDSEVIGQTHWAKVAAAGLTIETIQ